VKLLAQFRNSGVMDMYNQCNELNRPMREAIPPLRVHLELFFLFFFFLLRYVVAGSCLSKQPSPTPQDPVYQPITERKRENWRLRCAHRNSENTK
jgi:hypothetical protein